VRVVGRVYADAEQDGALDEAWLEALARSPFVGVLRRAIDLDLSLKTT
jgi:hypothetical protein